MQKVIAKINLKAIEKNAEYFKTLTDVRLCAVVKANAYGHGAAEVVNALSGVADCFAVALIEEAISIRSAVCGKDVLVFTPPTVEEDVFALQENGFIATVDSLSTARLVKKVADERKKPVRVHLKINTGMNRYGMNMQTLGKVCRLLCGNPYLLVEGVYSHLHGQTVLSAFAQRKIFLRAVEITKGYFTNVTAHLSATFGALLGKEFAFDMVRIGLGLYGYAPMPELPLKKAMQVYAQCVATRKYGFGTLGYGENIRREKFGSQISTLRFGYADGFLRVQRNGVEGYEKNANNLCMDACIRLQKGRVGEWLPVLTDAEETAKETGTIAYEVLCAATHRAEFCYEYK